MKIRVAPEYLEVVGSNCTVQEILEVAEDLKSLGFDERYDVYSELFREGWATDAGYILLPELWDNLDDVVDPIDLEIAYLIGSIQKSVLEDPSAGGYQAIVGPYVEPQRLAKTIGLLVKGSRFCNQNLPSDRCDELIKCLTDSK